LRLLHPLQNLTPGLLKVWFPTGHGFLLSRSNSGSNRARARPVPAKLDCVPTLFLCCRTEDEQHKVADAIVQHLESTNWKIEKGPPAEGHGQYLIPPR
jgi:hypothetical protein